MKLKRNDLWSLEEYAAERESFRAMILKHKKVRQVALGPHATLYFEDRLTMKYQVQEMLRVERIFEREEIEEELAAYNPANLIVGVLGGAAGTTRDTFELVAQTERFGGRVALFGRKIYLAEDAIEIVRLMRAVVEGGIGTIDAVKSYHDTLAAQGIAPSRTLETDLEVTDPVLKPEAE